jgi:hypothetical protein
MKLFEFNLNELKKVTHINIIETDTEKSIQLIHKEIIKGFEIANQENYNITKELKKGLNFKKANLLASNILLTLKNKNIPLKSIKILGIKNTSRLSLYNIIKTYIHEYDTEHN